MTTKQLEQFRRSDAARASMEIDAHTRKAFSETAADLSAAASRAVDRVLNSTHGDELDRLLRLYDTLSDAIYAVARV